MDVLTTYNNWRYKMIPVFNKRKSRWNHYCYPAQAWTWDVGSYFWYAN